MTDDQKEYIKACIKDFLADLSDDVRQLQSTVYGDAKTRQKGLVERLERIEDLLETLITQREALTNQIKGARLAFYALTAFTAAPWLEKLLQLLKIVP